ncbi:hypothetical protein B0H19DRAFT_1247799 [Mycena capillaripes]|nr:hypothetical protein B0H19DRAFT_1247799 [Mycena capillaripes]
MKSSITNLKSWETDHTFSICHSLQDNYWGFGSKSNIDEDEPLDHDSESEEIEMDKCRETYRHHRHSDDQTTKGIFLKTFEMFDFGGSFLHTERYSMAQASNPCLEIDGIGFVGLPLSAAAAQTLLSDSRASIEVDKLEISASEVRFTNPGWDTWFRKEANSVCVGLFGKKVQPVYKLKKLVLDGSNSQLAEYTCIFFAPHARLISSQ